jgi:hypothetical protein
MAATPVSVVTGGGGSLWAVAAMSYQLSER